MKVQDILQRKGDTVVAVASDTSVKELLRLLDENRIGAVVVSDDQQAIDGIVSERDVVRELHRQGPAVIDQPVSAIMTTQVHTCGPSDELAELARSMTEHRIRHLPVATEGRLTAIVSIGDVVKQRIEELTEERDQLVNYVQQ